MFSNYRFNSSMLMPLSPLNSIVIYHDASPLNSVVIYHNTSPLNTVVIYHDAFNHDAF